MNKCYALCATEIDCAISLTFKRLNYLSEIVPIVAGCRQIYKVEQWNKKYNVFDSLGTDIIVR